MIETTNLLPPDLGPRSNPVLFGVAEALGQLLPPVIPTPRSADDRAGDTEQTADSLLAEASPQAV